MVSRPKVRDPYDMEGSPGTDFSDSPSLTRQSEAREADINYIIARYEKNGVVPVDQREALFIDVSQMTNYQDVLEHVATAEAFFSQLPAGTRAKFDNSATVFLDRCMDPESRPVLVELGLLEADAAPPKAAAAASSEPPKAASGAS